MQIVRKFWFDMRSGYCFFWSYSYFMLMFESNHILTLSSSLISFFDFQCGKIWLESSYTCNATLSFHTFGNDCSIIGLFSPNNTSIFWKQKLWITVDRILTYALFNLSNYFIQVEGDAPYLKQTAFCSLKPLPIIVC